MAELVPGLIWDDCRYWRGSPTGIVFGYGAKFPKKYQNALFLCDWTYGRIVAVHLEEKGASYTGTFEDFLFGPGNPVADMVIHPNGAMYFVTGGRRNPSSLYEVTYIGDESTEKDEVKTGVSPAGELRKLRRQLESRHARVESDSVDFAWPHLSSADRHVRFAARTVLEHQPVDGWADKAVREKQPVAAIEAAVALARAGDASWREETLQNLNKLDFESLALEQQLDLLRAYGLVFIRMGSADDATSKHLVSALSPLYPSGTESLDHELCQMLLYLNAPGAVAKTVAKLAASETQSEQMFYSYHLRTIADGWSNEDLTAYATWMAVAEKNQGDYIGGGHFVNFLKMLDTEAGKRMSPEQRELVASVRKIAIPPQPTVDLGKREFVNKWTVAGLSSQVAAAETGRSFIRGRKLYEGMCSKCHLLKGKGGALGPDLTSAGRKYNHVAMLTEIIEPSKAISDQHASVILEMESGKILTGREVGGDKETIRLVTNPDKPTDVIVVKRSEIEVRKISPVSLMPLGMIDTLTAEEILDLLMFVASGGDRGHRAFQQ